MTASAALELHEADDHEAVLGVAVGGVIAGPSRI